MGITAEQKSTIKWEVDRAENWKKSAHKTLSTEQERIDVWKTKIKQK